MASRPRRWENLSPSTRKRYASKGRTLGQTEAQVKSFYESGGRMSVYRGHPTRPGNVSERMWTKMRAAAKASRMQRGLDEGSNISDVLESLLGKGFKPQWIIDRLIEQKESRDTYLSPTARYMRRINPHQDAGYQPGRSRFHNRVMHADIELFYYH